MLAVAHEFFCLLFVSGDSAEDGGVDGCSQSDGVDFFSDRFRDARVSSCFLGLLGVGYCRLPWLEDLLGLLVLPWWPPVVLCFYSLLKGEEESFFIWQEINKNIKSHVTA
ncbi:hypothetical protein U9M48_014465 [Paspalum notatum var. saurae]|uniref:Uncharacterized protein n=1 Tax=Paspalum notatum var. saurae TaxID=547442 RepID=A0AAQ3T1L8_PASNO